MIAVDTDILVRYLVRDDRNARVVDVMQFVVLVRVQPGYAGGRQGAGGAPSDDGDFLARIAARLNHRCVENPCRLHFLDRQQITTDS